MILGYCRVSTSKTEQDTSVKAQKAQLHAAGCERIVEERRSAFKAGKRPGWETCKELIRSGLVTQFIVVSLSRASRRQETAEMSELCNDCGVKFKSLAGGPVDVATPEGLLNVGIQDTVNRFDSLMKSVRVKQGMAARRQAGATAVGKCPFGYRYNGKHPEPDPAQWKLAQKLWSELEDHEFRANQVLRANPKWTDYFSNAGLYRWVRNPMLMGLPRYDCDPVEPLVSRDVWSRAQRIIDDRRFAGARAPRRLRLFSTMVLCDKCGAPLSYMYSGGKARLKCMRPHCEWYGRGLAEWKVRDQVIRELREAASQVVAVAKQPKTTKHRIDTAEQLELHKQLDQLLVLQQNGVPELDKSISDLRLRLRAVPETRPSADWSSLLPIIQAADVLEAFSDEQLRAVLLELVDEIRYVGRIDAVSVTLRDSADNATE